MQPFNKADEGMVEMSRLTIERLQLNTRGTFLSIIDCLGDSVAASSCPLVENYFVSVLLHRIIVELTALLPLIENINLYFFSSSSIHLTFRILYHPLFSSSRRALIERLFFLSFSFFFFLFLLISRQCSIPQTPAS